MGKGKTMRKPAFCKLLLITLAALALIMTAGCETRQEATVDDTTPDAEPDMPEEELVEEREREAADRNEEEVLPKGEMIIKEGEIHLLADQVDKVSNHLIQLPALRR